MTAVLKAASAFTRDQSTAGLRAAVAVLDKWQASGEQACRILRISRSTHVRARQPRAAQGQVDWTVSLDADQLQRVSLVLNMHSALRLVFDNPENLYGFAKLPNHNEFFNGRAPLEVMAQGDMISLYETFKRLDALRGGLW